jgi:hypothetical protein
LFKKISALLQKIVYPNLPSAIKPVTHCEVLPVPKPTESYTVDDDMTTTKTMMIVKQLQTCQRQR